MNTIEVDNKTYEAIDLVTRMTGMTHGQVVARLIEQSKPASSAPASAASLNEVAIYADYEGIRTRGTFDSATHRVTITDGPLASRTFKSPTGAAREIITHYKPSVSPHRNGWSFWLLDDGSGNVLQSVRHN